MTYTKVVFSLKSKFKKIVLTQESILVLKGLVLVFKGFTEIVLTPGLPLHLVLMYCTGSVPVDQQPTNPTLRLS